MTTKTTKRNASRVPKAKPGKRAKARDTSLGDQMIAGLESLIEHIRSGRPVEEKFTVHTVKFDLEPSAYDGARVKAVRDHFGASQPIFALFLGVSSATVKNWEQGLRPVPALARRFLDELLARPEMWADRVAFTTEGPKAK